MAEQLQKFEYGEAVRVAENAPAKFHPSEIVSVCGFRSIETEKQALTSGFPVQTLLYLVELGNGDAIEIPESFLSKYQK
jgi:hypothetical protein